MGRRLAAELSLDVLSPHEKDHLLTASRVAHRIGGRPPLAMYVIGLSVGSQLSDRARDDSIEDAIRAAAAPAAVRRELNRFAHPAVGWVP